jgi:uncharacterized repeat protein (TIGR01451 family)
MKKRYLRATVMKWYLFGITLFFSIMAHGDGCASLINQPMTGTTAPGWVIGGSAYLSASTGADPAGSGWLRLTEPVNNQAGYAFFDAPFDISSGVVIQFDYATWGGDGADGYSIFLFDSAYDATTFSAGGTGGSLGYAPNNQTAPTDPGLTGGYIGVGIDEYGNFSSPTEGRLGGPGLTINSASVRGPYNHPSGAYYYLGGSASLPTPAQALSFNNQMYRPAQGGTQYRKVVMYLTPVAAPNYLRVDVYVQFGAGQPLTSIVSGLNVGRPVPASVKVGYAASTGGSTNYHEIRNLLIDNLPTDINLTMSKTASASTVAPGATVTYTVKASNLGPNPITATNVPITDTVPAILTGVTWTCVGSGGATCVGGSCNNISTTATLPFNGTATYTITGTVPMGTPAGTVITNTASLAAPAGVTDYNSSDNSASATVTVSGATVSIAGMVYNDANHNGVLDGAETRTNVAGVYAKLFRSSNLTQTVAVATVTQATGLYSFPAVPSNETYTIIISATNTANVYDPSYPNASWIYTQPLNFTLTNVVVGSSSLTNQNLGVYFGTRIAGKVIKDDGAGGGSSTANDGVLNGSETGIAGVTVNVTTNAAPGVNLDTTTTDAGGNFVLFTNNASTTLRIYEINPAGYVSVNFNPGTTAGTYTMAGEYISFAYTRYTEYSGILFSDVPDNSFSPTPRAANGTPTSTLYYAHTFTPGSDGALTFATNSRTQGTWAAIAYYRDTACNGTYDVGDPLISAAVTAYAGVPVCILVKETIPVGATIGTTDQIVTRASFSYTNSVGPVVRTLDVTDTTTVVGIPQLLLLKSANVANATPGQVITYTVVVTNSGSGPATAVVLEDKMSPYSEFKFTPTPFTFTDGSTPSGLLLGIPVYSNDNGTTFSYTPVDTGGGYDRAITGWRIPMTGTMNSGSANFRISYQVRVK